MNKSFRPLESPPARRAEFLGKLRSIDFRVGEAMKNNETTLLWDLVSKLRTDFGNIFPDREDENALNHWGTVRPIIQKARDSFAAYSEIWNQYNALMTY